MKTLTKSQVLLLHEAMISETGGSSGIRDEGLLDSALNTPFQSCDLYISLYPDEQEEVLNILEKIKYLVTE